VRVASPATPRTASPRTSPIHRSVTFHVKHGPARAQETRHAPTPSHATKKRKPLPNLLRDSSHFTNQAIVPPEPPRTQKEAVPSSSRWDRFAVREGGVEPPRPCGHWNLNPARLPIPPPAHWVCPRALPFRCWRLPTSRRLARWGGWVHIPYPWRAPPRITGHGATSEGRTPAPLRHVSTSAGSRINLVPVPAISTGGGQGPQSGAGHWSRAASTILGRVRAGVVRRGAPVGSREGTSVGVGAGDTGRRGRPREPADFPARGYDQ
jgi:hypothetical protein